MSPHRDAGRIAAGVAIWILIGVAPVLAEADISAITLEALDLCRHADDLSGAEQVAAFTRGAQLAEEAIAANQRDAKAHFALVCNLGKHLKTSGIGLSSWSTLRRMRSELDATLALTPDDPEALTAKGALLFELPRLLGGDPAEAEQLLRRALTIDPDNDTARRYLAQVLEERGATEEARALLARR